MLSLDGNKGIDRTNVIVREWCGLVLDCIKADKFSTDGNYITELIDTCRTKMMYATSANKSKNYISLMTAREKYYIEEMFDKNEDNFALLHQFDFLLLPEDRIGLKHRLQMPLLKMCQNKKYGEIIFGLIMMSFIQYDKNFQSLHDLPSELKIGMYFLKTLL